MVNSIVIDMIIQIFEKWVAKLLWPSWFIQLYFWICDSWSIKMLTFTMLSSVLFHATCCHSPWRCVHFLIFICALPYSNIVVPQLLTDWWYYRDKPSIYGSSQGVGLFCYLALLSTYCKTRSRGSRTPMTWLIWYPWEYKQRLLMRWHQGKNVPHHLFHIFIIRIDTFSYWYTSHNFHSMQDHMGSCYNEFCIIVWESIINIMTNVDVNC